MTEKHELEELTADIALAIQEGLAGRFATEVVSYTQIVVTDSDKRQYEIMIREIPFT